MEVKKGTVDRSEYFYLRDSTTGEPKIGLLYNSAGAVASYLRSGGLRVEIELIAMDGDPSPDDAHVDGGFIEVDGTNMKGVYRLCAPDVAYVAGVDEVIFSLAFDGVSSEPLRVTLVDNSKKDVYDRIGAPEGASLSADILAHEVARGVMEVALTAEHDATQAAVATLAGLIADIDTSAQLAARFTELKGAGWSVESLKALYDLINATTLTGSRVTTIQLYETAGTTPIADTDVSVYNDDLSLYMGRRKTDANGQLVLGRDDGTYKLVPQKAGWTFVTPLTLTVTENATHIFYGDTVLIPQPGNPDACLLIIDLIDIGVEVSADVAFTVELKNPPKAVSGNIIDPSCKEFKTDVNGHLEITLVKGCKYDVKSKVLKQAAITIDTTGQTSINLADEL